MDTAVPFVDLFPSVFPLHRAVNTKYARDLVGVMVKSVLFHKCEEVLLCRGLVVEAQHISIHTTVHFKVTDIAPIVGYDLDLISDQDGETETWESVKKTWSKHFACEPVHTRVLHEDVKRRVNAQVFPLKRIGLAKKYVETVTGALTFGDFCPDKGYYVARDGNTPALCSNVMFGRVYFMPANKLNRDLRVSDLIYDHERSEAEAKLFDSKHAHHFYRSACLDIETVFDKSYLDTSLRCESFAYKFPYCTERMVADLTDYRKKLVLALNTGRSQLRKECKHVSIPVLAPDLPGQQHEITCISLVIINSHVPKVSKEHRRKELVVLYNTRKVAPGCNPHPEADHELAKSAGIDEVVRIKFYPCSGELALLENTIQILYRHGIELLYVFNAEFDLRVIEQRVHFYAASNYTKCTPAAAERRCASLLKAWHGLFVTRALAKDVPPFFQFENVRYLEMYKDMIKDVGSLLLGGTLTSYKLRAIYEHIEKFNKKKAKLGHFKMNACGMNVIDLYRVTGTREIKFACTSMKLNDIAPFVIANARELHGKPPKEARKLCKVADISYATMDEMIKRGGKSLFAVLVYNLVDSQLCARLATVLKPVPALFHRCRTTLNIDVIVHGRGDTFGGFVQSIHSVQMPQLKFALDSLRVRAGPAGKELSSRMRWVPDDSLDNEQRETWKGGSVCDPLTGLHYSGPGMGLELSFDFASMYPAIMCALNISPETTIPWPPTNFPHDLSGWLCYCWESEGFAYASLILKYDRNRGDFVRAPAVFASSVEYYLEQRSELKRRLKRPDLCESERTYYKTQEGECKVLANSFYGTAPHPCGPLISGHGRQQIAVVNRCVSTFYSHRCPVIYGDTDSVMVAVGYGPGELSEDEELVEVEELPDTDLRVKEERQRSGSVTEHLREFACRAREVIGEKFKRAGAEVPAFLDYVHTALVEDTLERMYVIGRGNTPVKVVRDPRRTLTDEGYPVYLASVPDSGKVMDITTPFVKGRRVRLEYENSCSIYCHVAKKTYVALTHSLDTEKRELSSISVKVRGLSAFKSVRSPCDSAVTETFISCVMKGDCIKLERDRISCFSTCPWHQLKRGDVILYPEQKLQVDHVSRWLELHRANSILISHRVTEVETLQLDSGFSAASVSLVPMRDGASGHGKLIVRTLYKDSQYCMNHMFSREQAIVRDLLMCKASEVIASKMGCGFFPWNSLIKSAKNKHFSQHTLERLKVASSSVRTTFVEIVKTWLKDITGLSVKPVECNEFHKCNPCEATFYRYPLNLQANTGCITAMFGGSLSCELAGSRSHNAYGKTVTRETIPESGHGDALQNEIVQAELTAHPYQPLNKCFSNSRVLIAHHADSELVNRSGKLLAHCIIDYCLPGRMYSSTMGPGSLKDCRAHLLERIAAVRVRLKRASLAFNSIMNNCPEHMIPACGTQELKDLRKNRETVSRISGEKLDVCLKVITQDMSLEPHAVYAHLSALLGMKLTEAMSEGTVSLWSTSTETSQGDRSRDNAFIVLSVPPVMLSDAGISSPTGGLCVTKSELCERDLVDLAGLVYQTILMLQINAPEVFSSSASRMYPESVLCIMPYSCADRELVRAWITVFKQKKWLRATEVKLGKRKWLTDGTEVKYHCVGCKNFYMDLYANNIPGQRLIQCVYGPDKKRKLGQCFNERRWLS